MSLLMRSGCREARRRAISGSQATCHDNRCPIPAGIPQEFGKAFGVIGGIHRDSWPLRFAKADQIGNDDFAAKGKVWIYFRPFVQEAPR